MLHRPKQLPAVAIHEAAYRVIANKLGVPLRPTPARLTYLCRYSTDVLDLGANTIYDLDPVAVGADTLERAAVVMFAGLAAIQHADLDPGYNRDFCEGVDLAYLAEAARVGGFENLAMYTWRQREETTAVRHAELGAQAAALVAENWQEIQAEAERLLAEPNRPRRKRA